MTNCISICRLVCKWICFGLANSDFLVNPSGRNAVWSLIGAVLEPHWYRCGQGNSRTARSVSESKNDGATSADFDWYGERGRAGLCGGRAGVRGGGRHGG